MHTQPDLTIADYHAGLRRLHDRAALRLLPYEGPNELPEPEYALLDAAATYYYVARGTFNPSQTAAVAGPAGLG